ncbi:hypothetical protein [Paenibacillus bovis]|uniref:Uncharacterized protein n=1 Tax=Paenibacillus bovis TaxID=1616788 RepID=A0A172ZBS2_9BACL|nr:hypothetical protein [Paenibacillus bovis]ANF95091.1 hypothetical protein AR543_02915 [Paenibacillus bovis]
MLNSQGLIESYSTLNEEEKIHFLRSFDQQLDITLVAFLLTIVTDRENDDDLRIEAVNILGLYQGNYNDEYIKEQLIKIIAAHDYEDDSLVVYCINTLSLLTVSDKEIDFAVNIIRSNSYILFKAAALELLRQHKYHPKAIEALKDLDKGTH